MSSSAKLVFGCFLAELLGTFLLVVSKHMRLSA